MRPRPPGPEPNHSSRRRRGVYAKLAFRGRGGDRLRMKACTELKGFFHCGLFSAGLGLVLSAHAAQFKFPTQTLTVPDGFEVELVAGPPLVERPVSADFDEQGRLYVTDSSGSNDT